MPCSGRTCSASNSTPAAPRSPRSPWPWRRGPIPDPTGSRWDIARLPTAEHRLLGAGSRRHRRRTGRSSPTAMVGSARGWSGSTTCSSSAPDLGSLLDPRTVTEDLFALGFDTLKGTVERALKKIEARDDPDRAALGVAAQGIALAASLMSREFTLVATNVPYLARGKQAETVAGLHRRGASSGEGRPGDGVRRAVPGLLPVGRHDGAW